jgi:lysophospholipase L1-like esterase
LIPAAIVSMSAMALAFVTTTSASALPTHAAKTASHPHTYVALGDSVAAGMGLQWRDWIIPDSCWRAGSDSYAGRFFSGWKKAAPKAEQGDYRFVLLGCKGAVASNIGSQIDGAIAEDPGLISLTIGANDLRFVYPERLFRTDGTLDRAQIDTNLAGLRTSLIADLTRLVDATAARIVVTTYHNPAAANPTGVPSCRGKCFSDAVTDVIAQLNSTIVSAVGTFAVDRVRLADVAPRFAAHGAPNGWGPDSWRQAGVPSWIPIPAAARTTLNDTRGIQAYCASGHNIWNDKNWVNGIDCVHPNSAGANAYAATISQVVNGWS